MPPTTVLAAPWARSYFVSRQGRGLGTSLSFKSCDRFQYENLTKSLVAREVVSIIL